MIMSTDTDTEEHLYDLYVAYCDRDSTTPTIRDYVIWRDEQGYSDDLEDVIV